MIERNLHGDVFSLVGSTPHVRVEVNEQPDARVYVKLEGNNPTGSVKDRACIAMIREKIESGELRPGRTILDASSGNMACAIAYFGRVLGYPTRVFSNSKLTDDKRAFIEYFGAELDVLGQFTIEGNRECRRIADAEPERYCFLDQLHNPANPRAHYEATGPEILATFPDLRMLVGSLGSGGSLVGTARYLKERLPGLTVVAVEAASGTRLPGTGAFVDGDYVTPFIERGYAEGLFDRTVRVHEEEAKQATRRLRDRGIFCGIQTGGVFHACLRSLGEEGTDGDVVFLSGDSGWKNMEKLSGL
jgi:cysteine synthase